MLARPHRWRTRNPVRWRNFPAAVPVRLSISFITQWSALRQEDKTPNDHRLIGVILDRMAWCRFADQYPMSAPEVVFVTTGTMASGEPWSAPVHPHIYSNGHICLSVLSDDWSPVCCSIAHAPARRVAFHDILRRWFQTW